MSRSDATSVRRPGVSAARQAVEVLDVEPTTRRPYRNYLEKPSARCWVTSRSPALLDIEAVESYHAVRRQRLCAGSTSSTTTALR